MTSFMITYFLVVILLISSLKSIPKTFAAIYRVYFDSDDGPAAPSEISPNSTFPKCKIATTVSKQL